MEPTKLEIWGLKLLLARIKSKSPKKYAILSKIAAAVGSLAGIYVIAYNAGFPHTSYDHLLGIIDNISIFIVALSTGVGFTAATTTKDPTLMDATVKANVIQEAVDNGTHAAIDTSNRGNDIN